MDLLVDVFVFAIARVLIGVAIRPLSVGDVRDRIARNLGIVFANRVEKQRYVGNDLNTVVKV